jgi:hypothetical protein
MSGAGGAAIYANRGVFGAESARFWAEMGRGRSKKAILAASGTLALGLLGVGCGPASHPNDPRPPLAAEVTVNITNSSVSAQPAAVGVKRANGASLNQNGVKEPSADTKEQIVNFTTSNTTATQTTLEIHGPGGLLKHSGPIVPEGNNAYKLALGTGHYTLEAADLPGAKPAPFYVGPVRISSQNDLLLP